MSVAELSPFLIAGLYSNQMATDGHRLFVSTRSVGKRQVDVYRLSDGRHLGNLGSNTGHLQPYVDSRIHLVTDLQDRLDWLHFSREGRLEHKEEIRRTLDKSKILVGPGDRFVEWTRSNVQLRSSADVLWSYSCPAAHQVVQVLCQASEVFPLLRSHSGSCQIVRIGVESGTPSSRRLVSCVLGKNREVCLAVSTRAVVLAITTGFLFFARKSGQLLFGMQHNLAELKQIMLVDNILYVLCHVGWRVLRFDISQLQVNKEVQARLASHRRERCVAARNGKKACNRTLIRTPRPRKARIRE